MIFLLQYDRRRGQLVDLRTFEDWEEANEARLDLELRLNRRRVKNEVVLLEATDEHALRRTHGRYFYSALDLAEAARGSVS